MELLLSEGMLAVVASGLTALVLHYFVYRPPGGGCGCPDCPDCPKKADDDAPAPSGGGRRASLGARPRFRRAESLKNEHVVFADEISADDEKFSPLPDEQLEEVEGILHNREEDPNILPGDLDLDLDLDLDEDEHARARAPMHNTFERIQPLDDCGLIRRKSLQLTPAGSSRGSTGNDLDRLADLDDTWDKRVELADAGAPAAAERSLKFAEDGAGRSKIPDDDGPTVKKVCQTLRRLEMSDDELGQVMEILLKKEEESDWVNKTKKPSALASLKKELEDKKSELSESSELQDSLQSKVKQIRAELNTERKDRRELEEENRGYKQKVEELDERLKLSESSRASEASESRESSPSREKLIGQLERLQAQLMSEKEENASLSRSVREQQDVIKAALKRVCPSMPIDVCQEHQERLDQYAARMRRSAEAETEAEVDGGSGGAQRN